VQVIRVRPGVSYYKIFSIIVLSSLYRVIRSSTGYLCKAIDLAHRCLVFCRYFFPWKVGKIEGGYFI
jgi:hypothetical protein